jgi:ferredoxin-NADP reductase
VAVRLYRTVWRLAEVIGVVPETPRTRSLLLEVPGWEGHKAGQHVDVRLTAPDGYQTQRSYSIASAPEEERVELVVERLDDGEVSPYLADELRAGDRLELRGTIGGWFTWEARDGGPLFLAGGGSRSSATPTSWTAATSWTTRARCPRWCATLSASMVSPWAAEYICSNSPRLEPADGGIR